MSHEHVDNGPNDSFGFFIYTNRPLGGGAGGTYPRAPKIHSASREQNPIVLNIVCTIVYPTQCTQVIPYCTNTRLYDHCIQPYTTTWKRQFTVHNLFMVLSILYVHADRNPGLPQVLP
jgi:hypothetical protein